jgi:PAS domain S-box-containing protein
MLDQNGNLTDKVIGTHVDITAQKKAEEEIMRERILLRTLIDNLPDTIYIKDAEGRKVIANKADVFTLGAATEAEVIGKTDLELFNNEIGERGYRDDMEVLRTGVPMLSKEEFFFDKQGNKNWLLTTKVPVRDDKGEVTRILGIGRNITHRKQTEDALNDLNQQLKLKSEKLSKQAEDLKALNEQIIQQKEQELEKAIAQGKFEIASEVLHDIGNALVGFGSHLNRINRVLERGNLDPIKNVALFLKSQYEAISGAIGNDKAAALLKITEGFLKAQSDNQTEIGSAISELIHIISHIQEILSIQRQLVRGHGGTHERKPVNLVSIIEDCRSMLFASFEKRGVQFKADIKPGNYVIKGDHTKLMQVFLNIIKNSLEAMPMDRPERKIQISLESADEKITLKITDNGDGFDEATRQRMFARGFTTKQSGTGLGLYNCRSIIESHVGSLEITSEGPGLGATSTIIFNN